jgi:hypothetical protein
LMGDSYTAGNGARKYFNATDNYGPKGCYRSNSNWGSKYSDILRSLGYNITLINRACSGAVSNDLLFEKSTSDLTSHLIANETANIQYSDSDENVKAKLRTANYCNKTSNGEEVYRINLLNHKPDTTYFECRKYLKPQLDSVDNSVDIILMTLGGNDLEFADVVAKCFAPIASEGSVCEKRIEESEKQLYTTNSASLKSNMNLIFTKLREKLRPDAKVVLLNYPYLAKNDNYEIGNRFTFGSYKAAANVRNLGRSGDELQRTIIPPNSTSKANIYYFDKVKEHFIGHEPDMSDPIFNNIDRWLNTFNNRMVADWFHFNPEGHKQVANILDKELTNQIGKLPAHSLTDYDVTFVFNESGDADWYGRDDINNKKLLVGKIIDKIQQQSASSRFSLIGYNLWTGSGGRTGPKYAQLKEFTSANGSFNQQLNKFNYPLGQTHPGALKDALSLANKQQWRPGVKKLIYIIGKTKLDDGTSLLPELYSEVINDTKQYTMAQIIPIRFTRSTSEIDDGANYIAQTFGSSTIQSSTPDRYNTDAIASLANNQTINTPYAWPGEEIVSAINQSITLNASGSYDSSGIIRYEWDINDDGTYDIVTADSIIEYTYQNLYEGVVRLRVTNSGGAHSIATLLVKITKDGDQIPDEIDNCPLESNEDQLDADSDGMGDICDVDPGIPGYQEPPEPTIENTASKSIDSNGSNLNQSEIISQANPQSTSKNINATPISSLDRIITAISENEFSPEYLPELAAQNHIKNIKKSFDVFKRAGIKKWLIGGVTGTLIISRIVFRLRSTGIEWHLSK